MNNPLAKAALLAAMLHLHVLLTPQIQAQVLVTNLPLDAERPMEVPVGIANVTTISFPYTIEAIDAAGVTTDGRAPALFQLAYLRLNSFFSVRALLPGAIANVNVRSAQKTYVLVLKESKMPWLAVNLSKRSATAPTSPAAPPLSATQLLGLIDRARNYEALKQHHPELVADVTFARPRSTTDYPDFLVRLDEVFRFSGADALAFHVTLRSKVQREVRYRPGSWQVRVGDHLFPQAIADGNGVLPPLGEQRVWFVIQGAPDGQRTHLSVNNAFVILVNLN
ncbi:MAG: hypothetical protein JNN07_22855 [Verrucomicrobiales bacterium]|nr:hypothetical protein [Verrucomicrobiales bacterium]